MLSTTQYIDGAMGGKHNLPTSPSQVAFKDSSEAVIRRLAREAIRGAKFTRTERDIFAYVSNLWFYHKAKGVMAPGREKIAAKVGCSIRSVASALSKLRNAGVLVVTGCATGGKGNTRYRFDLRALFVFCGREIPEEIPGQLVPLDAYRNVIDLVPADAPDAEPEIARGARAKIARGEPASHAHVGRARVCAFPTVEDADGEKPAAGRSPGSLPKALTASLGHPFQSGMTNSESAAIASLGWGPVTTCKLELTLGEVSA